MAHCRRLWGFILAAAAVMTAPAVVVADAILPISTFRDKLEGAWVGQMAGVAWGAPTEFGWKGVIIPEANVPNWSPSWINRAFDQDDLYVEIPFIQAMTDHGANVPVSVFGDYFRDTQFPLWVANAAARNNLRGSLGKPPIPAPDSGHPLHNPYHDAIDWQIEANFAGILAPAMPRAAIELAWRAGHVMNYGDGVYGGVAVAAMHSAAYVASGVTEIIQAGRNSLPPGSRYRDAVDDLIAWHSQDPDPTTWEDTWQLFENKYGRGPGVFDIRAVNNGAYIFIGLLYGQGDIEQSMRIAMRCGQDSDCNPSSVGGILGAWLGLSNLPDKYKSALDRTGINFSYTEGNFEQTMSASEALARHVLLLRGGSIAGGNADGVWNIPDEGPIAPPILETWNCGDMPQLSAVVVDVTGLTIRVAAQASAPDGILGYQWFFGDLSYRDGPATGHTYNAAGAYEIIAYAASAQGKTSWRRLWVDVAPATCWRRDPLHPGEWASADAWNAGVPSGAVDVIIDNAGTVIAGEGDHAARDVYIGKWTGGALELTGGRMQARSFILGEHDGSAGTLDVASPLIADMIAVGPAGTGVLRLHPGANLTAGQVTGHGGVDVLGGVARIGCLQAEFLTVEGAGRIVLTDSATASRVRTITLADSARLNLVNSGLVIEAAVPSQIRQLIASAYASGAWDGGGIYSDLIAPGVHGIGYAAGDHPQLFHLKGTLAGQPFGPGSVIVRLASLGDANLDGMVGFADLGLLLSRYGEGGGWIDGDFDYDGLVGLADLGLMLNNYGATGLSAGLDQDAISLLSDHGFQVGDNAVPEPGAAAILPVAALVLCRRRVFAHGSICR